MNLITPEWSLSPFRKGHQTTSAPAEKPIVAKTHHTPMHRGGGDIGSIFMLPAIAMVRAIPCAGRKSTLPRFAGEGVDHSRDLGTGQGIAPIRGLHRRASRGWALES
jgi:hypothetical protein